MGSKAKLTRLSSIQGWQPRSIVSRKELPRHSIPPFLLHYCQWQMPSRDFVGIFQIEVRDSHAIQYSIRRRRAKNACYPIFNKKKESKECISAIENSQLQTRKTTGIRPLQTTIGQNEDNKSWSAATTTEEGSLNAIELAFRFNFQKNCTLNDGTQPCNTGWEARVSVVHPQIE